LELFLKIKDNILHFIETRGNDNNHKLKSKFSEALLSPSASFGGLYVPQNIPKLDDDFMNEFKNKSYKDLAFAILKKFDIDIEDNQIKKALELYDNFDSKEPTPLVKIDDNLFSNELYHGPTKAFKDMALQPFGSILSHLAQKDNQNYLIMAATSGDTGPAALHTFRDKNNIKVVCLYPVGGTSDVQLLQMVTENATNTKVIGIKGNFDDAQNSLKKLLADDDFKNKLQEKNTLLSAANSVNFGRIIFQIIYHIKSYLQLLKLKEIKNREPIYSIIPSGNFGNALGAYYTKLMGINIKKILITSNENSVLEEFVTSGEYDIKNRQLKKTTSPAMDILKSSNVERVLFHKFGANRTKELMDEFAKNSKYKLTEKELRLLQEDFDAISCNDEYTKNTIKKYFNDYNYLMDTHTATTIKAYENLRKDNIKTIICSTAQWTKFSPTIYSAIQDENIEITDKEALEKISQKCGAKIPDTIKELFLKDISENLIIDRDKIKDEILKFI
jgi:threonine synthase